MSDQQWAEIMTGDESYAGLVLLRNYKIELLKLLDFSIFCLHIKESRRKCLFSTMVKEGDVVPGNSHFDTTKGI